MKTAPPSKDVVVGSEKGFLKIVDLSQNSFINHNVSDVPQDRLSCMSSVGPDDVEILCGLLNGRLRIFDSLNGSFSSAFETRQSNKEGDLKSVAISNDRLITGFDSGVVRLWNRNGNQEAEFSAAENLRKLRTNPASPNILCTGGRENPLKCWDLASDCSKPIFEAKNVKENWLCLRQPVWVADMQFMPASNRILTATGYHQLRLYDPKCGQRRPVLEYVFPDKLPFTCVCLTPKEHCVVAGNTEGKLALFDLRGKGRLVHTFKGFAGTITDVQCHATAPIVTSCGLDRFLLVHNLETRELLHKIYVKGRARCLALSKDLSILRSPIKEECVEDEEQDVAPDESANGVDSDDDTWQRMKTVSDGTAAASDKKKKKRKPNDDVATKAKKKARKALLRKHALVSSGSDESQESASNEFRRSKKLHSAPSRKNQSETSALLVSKTTGMSDGSKRKFDRTEIAVENVNAGHPKKRKQYSTN